jgi:hypothetical protein
LPFARELKVETRCGKTAMSSSEQLVEQLAQSGGNTCMRWTSKYFRSKSGLP